MMTLAELQTGEDEIATSFALGKMSLEEFALAHSRLLLRFQNENDLAPARTAGYEPAAPVAAPLRGIARGATETHNLEQEGATPSPATSSAGTSYTPAHPAAPHPAASSADAQSVLPTPQLSPRAAEASFSSQPGLEPGSTWSTHNPFPKGRWS